LFIIPGIWIGIRLATSTQALVVEGRRRPRPWAGPGRWSVGTGGTPWHLVVAGLLTFVVNALITTHHDPSPSRPNPVLERTVKAPASPAVTVPRPDRAG
jgi:hypothetical protein